MTTTTRPGGGALRGGSLLAAGTLVERLARLGRNMLLARVIAPDQFGIMAITLAVLALYEAITEVGVAQAVIQNKRGSTPEFLNVAWWFGVARGLIVGIIALPLASPIARFYDMPELVPLLMVAPVSILFTGLTSPRVYALQRQFRFGATLTAIQGAGLLGTAMAIVLGFWLQNVWALLWGTVFEAFARFVLSFVVCPIRPRFRLDKESRTDLFRFTKGMAGLSVLTLLIMQADTFVLGKVISAEDLGLYTMAITLAAFPLMIFSKVVQPLVVPMLANVQDDLGALRSKVLQLSRLVWLFGLPLTAVLGLSGGPLLVLVYGRPELVRMAPAFAVYSLFSIVYMASMVTFSVYLALGRPELQRKFTLVRAILVVILLYPLADAFGGFGAAVALLVAMVGAMAVQLVNLRSITGLTLNAYLKTPLSGLLVALSAALPLAALKLGGVVGGWVEVLTAAAIGAIAWTTLVLRERKSLRRLKDR